MVFRVQVIEGQYVIVIPADAMAAMGLRDGSVVEVLAVGPETDGNRYMSVEEGMAAYFKTEPLHRNTYRELAKGPGAPEEDPTE